VGRTRVRLFYEHTYMYCMPTFKALIINNPLIKPNRTLMFRYFVLHIVLNIITVLI